GAGGGRGGQREGRDRRKRAPPATGSGRTPSRRRTSPPARPRAQPARPPRCAAARAGSDAGRPGSGPPTRRLQGRPPRPSSRVLLLGLPPLERLLRPLEERVVHEALHEVVIALDALGGDLL